MPVVGHPVCRIELEEELAVAIGVDEIVDPPTPRSYRIAVPGSDPFVVQPDVELPEVVVESHGDPLTCYPVFLRESFVVPVHTACSASVSLDTRFAPSEKDFTLSGHLEPFWIGETVKDGADVA